jgi:hypothetical protein
VIKPRNPNPSNRGMNQPVPRLCPSEAKLAAYLDDRLEPEARREFEAHAVECDDCRAVVSDAAAALSSFEPVRPRRRRLGAVPGAAAVAAAAVLLLVLLRPGAAPQPDEPVLRATAPSSAAEDAARFDAAGPGDDGNVDATRDELAFSWAALPEGTVYQVAVMNEQGVVAWSERTELQRLAMPAAAAGALHADSLYFWRVEALLPDLRTAASPLHSFRIRDR